MPAAPNPPRNTYTPEEQERNDAIRDQHTRQVAYASRFFRTGD